MSRFEDRKGATVALRLKLLEGDADRQEARVNQLLVSAVALLGSAATAAVIALLTR